MPTKMHNDSASQNDDMSKNRPSTQGDQSKTKGHSSQVTSKTTHKTGTKDAHVNNNTSSRSSRK
jgi:hypothetical protein